MGFVERHIDREWEWGAKGLSSNLSIPLAFVSRYPSKRWNWNIISARPDLTEEFIEDHKDKPWCWGSRVCSPRVFGKRYVGLSTSGCVTAKLIDKLVDKPWDFYRLSSNTRIATDFIERHIDRGWVWGENGLSSNPNITPVFFARHYDKPWSHEGLLCNQFQLQKRVAFETLVDTSLNTGGTLPLVDNVLSFL